MAIERHTGKAQAVAASRAIKPALMAGALIAIASALPLMGGGAAQSALAEMLGQGGVQGPAMFLALSTLLVAIGLPRQIPAFVAGYAFGPWYGAIVALVAQVLACSLDFIWARALGQNFVRRRFGKTLAKIDRRFTAQPFLATLTLRLLPVGSNVVLNLAGGLSSIRMLPFLTASAIGFIPQTLMFAFFGQGATPAHTQMLLLGGAMFLISAVLGLILLRRGDPAAEPALPTA